ncbi:hypothetical protein LY90DRAFT_632074 [Neocallimastix californiae]|uniref:Transmembrane protein n=1 Tax=Neocallimastix californiae TaxID=1754190 RepID=A0A1Y2AI66_9FUNG|nr:hypothetical protein LY90DRAFT_632074 [Neocallimastix californiae]|eukprot:ORY22279.1 hypothetical protein LY90DRAFT_632074 [Neocallimastix californiae]
MKISYLLLILIASTLSFSYHIQKIIYKREEVLELDSVVECENAIKNECNLDINKDNIDTVCTSLNSDKCQNLVNGISSINTCVNLGEDFLSLKKNMINLQFIAVEFLCSKDENGNYCPYTNFELEHSTLIGDEIDDVEIDNVGESQIRENEKKVKEEGFNAIKNSCKSEICTDAFLKILPQLENYEKNYQIKYVKYNNNVKDNLQFQSGMTETSNFNKIINYLESDECRSKKLFQNSSSDATSNHTTINYNFFLTIFGLLLLSILF